MENNENITTLEGVAIKEEEAFAAGVSSLRDAPNRSGGFGHNSLTAEQLKQRFDKLPKLIIARLNALVSLMQSGVLGDSFRIEGNKGIQPLSDYLKSFADAVEANEYADRKAKEAEEAAKKYADERIPPVTEDDNGKFMRVVAGAWAAVEIPYAEGEEY